MDVELSFCGAKLAALPDCTDHALLGPPLTQAFGAADVFDGSRRKVTGTFCKALV